MGWTITLYDEDGKELVSFNRSSALEQKFKRDTDGLDSLFLQTMRQKRKVYVDFEEFWEVDSCDAFYYYTLWIHTVRANFFYKKGANNGPIRVDMWGDPYFADKPSNHPPPTADDLVGFNIHAARLGMIEEQFYDVVKASNDCPDGYWRF